MKTNVVNQRLGRINQCRFETFVCLLINSWLDLRRAAKKPQERSHVMSQAAANRNEWRQPARN